MRQRSASRDRGRAAAKRRQLTEGAGTGFIIDKAGYILTNNHVVEGADKITVAFVGAARTEEYAAKVVGHDPLTDSALIQLTEMPSAPLQEAKFGDSSQMQQGDWVMAIGNPFNLGHTVTVGVISALDRPLRRRRDASAADDPDRRGDQSRQLGRTAAQHPRRSDRHEHGDLHRRAARGQHRHRLRDADQHDPRAAAAAARPARSRAASSACRSAATRSPRSWPKRSACRTPTARWSSSVAPNTPAAKAGLEPRRRDRRVQRPPGRPTATRWSRWSSATKPGTTVPVTIYRDNQRKTLSITPDELDLEAEANGGRRRGRTAPEREAPTATDFGMQLEADYA